jgi:hypothetical protein
VGAAASPIILFVGTVPRRRKEKEVSRKRLAMALMPATMAASAGAASAAPVNNDGEHEKAAKKAAPGFTTQGSKRLSTSESP